MAALVWKHNRTREEARELIQRRLHEAGHDSKVAWKGDSLSASIGWGAILSLSGEVTDDALVLENCTGALSGFVLSKCREGLAHLFPGGEQVQANSGQAD